MKNLVAFILVTILHNFLVSPAFASLNNNEVMDVQEKTAYVVIKSPSSSTHRFERIHSAPEIEPTETNLAFAKNFKVINQPKTDSPLLAAKKSHKNKDFSIATAGNTPTGSKRMFVTLTAYNSEVAQTDPSPCITANGFNVCEHGIEDTIATNALPFGTEVIIPDLFGDRVFVVRDRTNKRYTTRVDVWMQTRKDALQFGVRHAEVIVLE